MAPRIWLITDTHFFHAGMVEFCGRPSDFGERIRRNWARMVQPDDRVFHLGDVAVGHDLEAAEIITVLPGRKVLIRGNHDRKSLAWYLDHGWDAVLDRAVMTVGGETVLLSHTPEEEGPWFTLNIHGHFHNTDFRRHEPHLAQRLGPKHVLLALEETGYQPVPLLSVIERGRRFSTGSGQAG